MYISCFNQNQIRKNPNHNPTMKKILLLFLGLCLMSLVSCEVSNKREGEPKVLVFSKTAGFNHAAIPEGIKAISSGYMPQPIPNTIGAGMANL